MWLIFVFFHIRGDGLLAQTTFFQSVFRTEQDTNDETPRPQPLTTQDHDGSPTTRLLPGIFQEDEMDVSEDTICASGSASLL